MPCFKVTSVQQQVLVVLDPHGAYTLPLFCPLPFSSLLEEFSCLRWSWTPVVLNILHPPLASRPSCPALSMAVAPLLKSFLFINKFNPKQSKTSKEPIYGICWATASSSRQERWPAKQLSTCGAWVGNIFSPLHTREDWPILKINILEFLWTISPLAGKSARCPCPSIQLLPTEQGGFVSTWDSFFSQPTIMIELLV